MESYVSHQIKSTVCQLIKAIRRTCLQSSLDFLRNRVLISDTLAQSSAVMLTINEEGHDHFDHNLLSEFRAICKHFNISSA